MEMENRRQLWMPWALGLAGVYAVVWGVALIGWPSAIGKLTGISSDQSRMLAPLGVFTVALGLGLLLAESSPLRHWPVVLIGLTAKLGLFANVAIDYSRGDVPQSTLWLATFNDLVWVAPFGLILAEVRRLSVDSRRLSAPEILRLALSRKTNYGVTLDELSHMGPVLLVFLRHAGCTFCREALADLAAKRPEIEQSGTRLVLVHMGTEENGSRFFSRYGLGEVPQISDPRRNLYRAFGLPRGSFADLFGPKVWVRGFQAAILGRHGIGRLAGDGFQMPGAFLLFHGEVLRSYRHQSAADRPDYLALATGRGRTKAELQR